MLPVSAPSDSLPIDPDEPLFITSVRLTRSEHDALKRYARENDLTLAQLFRRYARDVRAARPDAN